MEQKTMIERVEQFDIFNVLPELSTLIFSFLPVQSLLVLRSVCKWFLSIIDDPKFIRFHLNNFPSNALHNRYRYLNFHNHGKYEYSATLVLSPTDKVIIDSIYDKPEEANVSYAKLQGSIDGLVLLAEMSGNDDTFLLWNPSMKKHRWLSPPPEESVRGYGVAFVAIGFDGARDDYKVIAMYTEKVFVYSIKKASWTILDFDIHKLQGRYVRYTDYLAITDGILVYETHSNPIMSTSVFFDFETEIFHYSNYQPIGIELKFEPRFMKLDGGSTIGMIGYDEDDQPSIWALETRTMSYSKRYNVSRELMKPFELVLDGELVLNYHKGNYENEVYCVEELLYDIESEVIKRHPWLKDVDAYYIESMIVP